MSVILSHRWSVNAACHSAQPFSSLRSRSASGKLFLFTLLEPFCALLSGFLQANPFQSIISPKLRWSEGRRAPERGSRLKRCGIFLSVLAPMDTRHMVLWPFLHALSFPCFASYDFLVLGNSSRLSKRKSVYFTYVL